VNEGNSGRQRRDARLAVDAAVVAPEVAARIVALREAGEGVSDIGHSLNLTPGEMSAVLRAAERTERVGQ